MRKLLILILILILFLCSHFPLYSFSYPIKIEEKPLIRDSEHHYKESDYVKAYCNGSIEYVLNDKTRIDCLTEKYTIEFDWAKKWAESVGQTLYYSKMTNKLPAVAIIMKSPQDEKYIKRIIKIDKDITIFKIKAY